MAFLTQEELKTHIRDEHVELLSRGDDTIVAAAIDGAIEEAWGELVNLYDAEDIFSKEGDQRNALLLIMVKNIAVYHFIVLTHSGGYLERWQKLYDRAVQWLKDAGRGETSPRLPRKKDEEGNPQAGLIYSSSNPKRGQHF